MKLRRRYIRNIRQNLSFYIASTVLTMAALFLFFLFHIAGNAILDFADEFFEKQKLEDAHFTTYIPITESDIEDMEEEYGITLEVQSYLNIDTDGTTARVFQKTRKVDLYDVTVGEDANEKGEVILSEGYAVNMDISIGDQIRIGEEDYTVTGFFQRPDYLYMLENEDDSYKNISTFFLAYMSEKDFAELGETNCQYLVRYNGNDDADFRRAVNEKYHMYSYTAAEENQRIVMVRSQAEMFLIMSWMLLCILPLVAVALICIIINRKVKTEQQMIGTLSAMGYTRAQLARHYAGFAAIPGIIGGVLTSVITAVVVQPYGELGLTDYEPMRISCSLSWYAAVLGIAVPAVMYILAALLSVRGLLRQNTVLLLNGSADEGRRKLRRVLAGRKLSFRVKFAVRSLIGSPARSFVVFLGIFLGSFIMLTGFSIYDSARHMADTVQEAAGEYEYQYVLGEPLYENPYGGELILAAPVEDEKGDALTVMGTDNEQSLLNLTDKEGQEISTKDGYYITSLTAYLCGWETGDRVTLYNPLSLEQIRIRISGIVENDTAQIIYTSRANAAEMTGVDKNAGNMIISEERLDIPENIVESESRKSDLKEQVDTIIDQTSYMIDTMVGLGIMICIASVYVAVNMLVSENRRNISMLKVLGYPDRKIGRIVLGSNHVFLPLGILMSIPAAYAFCGLFFRMFADMMGMLVSPYLELKSCIMAAVLTAGSYLASMHFVGWKTRKVDAAECLKAQRE
ncbi:ABC transporter permease [Merdimonas faecis]|uniref:FtsX-like permease family protein n=1 Tax=Merdimonas faecis TaxID=1653435 RepID=A0A9D3AJ11_9FIRM|nr:FtsX-like permease family protein [Merdimonas faecis]HJH49231.1 FtsX-like permease family protein [Merdimonas faecis]